MGAIGGVEPQNVEGFKEYGSKLAKGGNVITSQRKGHILSDNDAKDLDMKKFINDWKLTYM